MTSISKVTDHDGAQAPALAQALATVLGRVPAVRQRVHDVMHGPLAPSSPRRLESDELLGRMAYDHAAYAIHAAVDHLIAWQAVHCIARIQPQAASFAMARGALETSFTAYWLLEGSRQERLRRGVIAANVDLDERRKFERAASVPAPTATGSAKSADQRQADLLSSAAAASLTTPKNGKHRIETPPSNIDLFRRHPITGPGQSDPHGDEWLYRALSGMAHGFQWTVLLQTNHHVASGLASVGGSSGGATIRSTANDRLTLGCAEWAMASVDRAVDRLGALGT